MKQFILSQVTGLQIFSKYYSSILDLSQATPSSDCFPNQKKKKKLD